MTVVNADDLGRMNTSWTDPEADIWEGGWESRGTRMPPPSRLRGTWDVTQDGDRGWEGSSGEGSRGLGWTPDPDTGYGRDTSSAAAVEEESESGNGVGNKLLADPISFGGERWDPSKWLGGGSGGGGGGGGGNVGRMEDFTYETMPYTPYGGADIQAEKFDETIAYDPYAGSFTADRFSFGTDPYRGDRFTAPSYEQAMQDPGYQFRLAQGQQALENTAAARGMLRTGGTMKGLLDYNQALASQEYDKSYGRALGEYQMGYSQEVTADREQFAREAQKFGMNRQAALDQYDRDFQKHQANQGGLSRAYGQRMGAHQMNVSNELAARQSNLMKYGQNLAAKEGAWDRMYMGGKDQYGFGMDRARLVDAEAQAAAARSSAASNREYNRARADYLLGYEQDVFADERRHRRLMDIRNTPHTVEPPP